MAYEIPGFSWSLVAGVDLSASQFCGVDINTSSQARLPTGAGARIVGVVQNKPASGQNATIVTSGITKMRVGTGGVTAGGLVTVDAAGKAVAAATGNTILGRAIKANANGELGTILLLLSSEATAP